MKKNPIMRSKQGDVTPGINLDIIRQGSIPYTRTEMMSTPSTEKGQKSGRMEVKGRGAMLRATTFSVR
jgi:hypothetical protein